MSTTLGQARGNTKGARPDTGQLSEMERSYPFVILRVDSIYTRFQFLLVMPCFFVQFYVHAGVAFSKGEILQQSKEYPTIFELCHLFRYCLFLSC